ncbi:MAG: hypothetical protein E5X53_19000 [Mesorhizobium sp.]|nr:MAG: hypothetical protein E5X53_19000 [Mesorhizobium sp.]
MPLFGDGFPGRAEIFLTVPVTLFEDGGEYGVMPSNDLAEGEVLIVHEYDSNAGSLGRPSPVCRLRAGGGKGGCAAAG